MGGFLVKLTAEPAAPTEPATPAAPAAPAVPAAPNLGQLRQTPWTSRITNKQTFSTFFKSSYSLYWELRAAIEELKPTQAPSK